MIEDAIRFTLRNMLGIHESQHYFDVTITHHANSAIMMLDQLGVPLKPGFTLYSDDQFWEDLLVDPSQFHAVKTYIYLYVRLMFDPPTASLLTALKEQLKELEWRLNVQAETLQLKNSVRTNVFDEDRQNGSFEG